MPIRRRDFFHKFEFFLLSLRKIDHKVFSVDSIYSIESTVDGGPDRREPPAPPVEKKEELGRFLAKKNGARKKFIFATFTSKTIKAIERS